MEQIFTLLIIFVIIILVYYFTKSTKSEATYVKSNLDGKEYLVQNLEDKEEAAHMLSLIRKRIFLFRDYLKDNITKFPEYQNYIEQFCNQIKDVTLAENAPNGEYTSYTLNKGEEINLCLRSRENKKLHDMNLIMYVVLHELSHVACPKSDFDPNDSHTPLFKKIFVFFLQEAIAIKLYKQTNYQLDPKEYCGMTINENLLK